MALKTSQPALYEKMRSRQGGVVVAPPRVEPPPPPESLNGEVAAGWLRPGQMVRMPVGYVLLAAGLVIALSAAAYMVGHNRGQAVERLKLAENLSQSSPLGAEAVTLDPMTESQASPASGMKAATTTEKAVRPPARSGNSTTWGAVEPKVDPRKKGLNYFVLAETTQQGAIRLADFCRTHGLETYVVPGKNDRLRRIVTLPGFASSARSSPEIKALEALIHNVGDKWKKTQRGDTDLRDAYPSLFGG